MKSSILTYVRIKSTDDAPEYGKEYVKIQDKKYQADAVMYGPDQEVLFRSIASSILGRCVQGYNCSIFAYGQTGSGKTYTIQGNEQCPGLVPRSLAYLHERYLNIKLSFIEIYNENMFDLFEPSNSVGIRDDPAAGITVDNLSILPSETLEESLSLYRQGIANRRTTATQFNENSSRSHAILTIFLEQKENHVIKKSRLCFVDLAGSEKCRENESERIKETCNINKSLLCLGKIVHKLSSNDRWHVSYRDSKLTFLLKDSLGGNCQLAIIGNINPDFPAETANTLQFLARSKRVTNNPSLNYDTAQASMEELTAAMIKLEEENGALRDEVALLRKSTERNVGEGALFLIRTLGADLGDMAKKLLLVKEKSNKLASAHFDDNMGKMRQLNEQMISLNEFMKENIADLCIKKRRL